MSLSPDVLSRATPTRLLCRAGRWTLELTRLEAVDRDVFQPRTSRLEGSEAILAALRRGERTDEAQQLATGAAQLMRGARNDEDRAFDVNEGDWVPSADAAAPAPRVTKDRELEALTGTVAELRAELLVLRASHARLRERVMALEAQQNGVPHNVRPARGGRGQRRKSEPPPAFAPVGSPPGVAFAATQASPGIKPHSPSEAEAVSPAPGLPSLDAMASALAGQAAPPPLTLPTTESLAECLAGLLGSAPELEKLPEQDFATLSGAYGCKLLDDEGRERGAIVLDLAAVVGLGAALLGLARDEAERQLRESSPSPDVISAMSEICNHLAGPLNSAPGNQPIHSSVLAPIEAKDLPEARRRLDLSAVGGRLVLALF